MNPIAQLPSLLALILLGLALLASAQKSLPSSHKGSPEILEVPAVAQLYGNPDSELINKVQGQLYNTLELLQAYQEGGPFKLAEKRRNKFEFIRFGRR